MLPCRSVSEWYKYLRLLLYQVCDTGESESSMHTACLAYKAKRVPVIFLFLTNFQTKKIQTKLIRSHIGLYIAWIRPIVLLWLDIYIIIVLLQSVVNQRHSLGEQDEEVSDSYGIE